MVASHATAAARAGPTAGPDDGQTELLLCRVDDYCFALPTAAVERILRMAAFDVLAGAPQGVVGSLMLQGSRLPVVDPRVHLGMRSATPDPAQRLIVMSAGSRFALWVDVVERMVSVPNRDLDALEADSDRPLVPFVARIDGVVTWLLSPTALDPVRPAEAAA